MAMGYYPAPKKKSRTGLIVGLIAAVIAVVCGCGVVLAATSDGKKPGAPKVTEGPVAPASPTTAAAAQATTQAAAPAAPTIADGTWTVGPDFPAGRYKTTGSGEQCYWAIYKSGQNQSFDALIDNHLGGGNLRVTLKAGQDFETKRCGTWTKA